MIFNLYIFDKAGSCLYYNEWFRPQSTLKDMPEEDRKLMFGLIFSLKLLMNQASPVPCVTRPPTHPSARAVIVSRLAAGATRKPRCAHLTQLAPLPHPRSEPAAQLPLLGPEHGFFRYATDAYTLFHLETPTGYKFAITADAASGDLRPALWTIYAEIFTQYALRNPLYSPGQPITNTGFHAAIDGFVKGLPS